MTVYAEAQHAGVVPRKIKTNPNDEFIAVKTHFAEYERFRIGKKKVEDAVVMLVSLGPGKEHEGRSDISSAVTVGECFFEAQISPRVPLKYQLKYSVGFMARSPACASIHVVCSTEMQKAAPAFRRGECHLPTSTKLTMTGG